MQALDEIRSIFQTARTIEDEIKDISCDWRFSARVETLKLSLQGLGGSTRSAPPKT